MNKMKIYEYLAENEEKIIPYFKKENAEAWVGDYEKKIPYVAHDEPWVTLVALYSILGDQSGLDNQSRNTHPQVIDALQDLLEHSGAKWEYQIESIEEIKVEFQPPEILAYREKIKSIAGSGYHPYPDRNKVLKGKAKKGTASFEGNTNMDVYMRLNCGRRRVAVIIEAKFLSDISYQITYNPVRDQIARNVDCGISMLGGVDYDEGDELIVDDFYFLLLTPGMFRPASFGDRGAYVLDEFGPERSRLYCYKMLDYRDPDLLAAALPHRKDVPFSWEHISSHIGWITYEQMIGISNTRGLVSDANEKKAIDEFFRERQISNA